MACEFFLPEFVAVSMTETDGLIEEMHSDTETAYLNGTFIEESINRHFYKEEAHFPMTDVVNFERPIFENSPYIQALLPKGAMITADLSDVFVEDPINEHYCTQASILQMCLRDYPDPYDGVSTSNDGFPCDEPAVAWYPEVTYADPPAAEDAAATGRHECLACSRHFASKSKLVRHLRVKHGPRVRHGCGVCGKHFASPSSLRMHSYLHTGERPFRCAECGEGFMRRRLLDQHRLENHGLPLHRLENDGLPLHRLENDGLPSLRLENDGLPSLRLENDGLPSLRLENDGLPSLRLENDGLPSHRLENDGLPSLRLVNDGLPLHRLENHGMPLHRLENDGLPLHRLENDGLPSLRLENDGLPLHRLENDGLPLHRLENDGLPSLRLVNDGLPLHRLENDGLPSLRLENDGLPSLRLVNDGLPLHRLENYGLPALRLENDGLPSHHLQNDGLHSDRPRSGARKHEVDEDRQVVHRQVEAGGGCVLSQESAPACARGCGGCVASEACSGADDDGDSVDLTLQHGMEGSEGNREAIVLRLVRRKQEPESWKVIQLTKLETAERTGL